MPDIFTIITQNHLHNPLQSAYRKGYGNESARL